MILLGRILQGIGASGAMPIVLPLVGDLFQRESVASATLGIIETANTAGKVLSPILGAALTAVIWFLPFFSIPLFCLISVLMVIFLIKKKNDSNETPVPFKQYIKDIKDVFKNHKRWLIAVFIICFILIFILYYFCFISVLIVIFLIKKKNDSNYTPVPFKQYIKDIKDVFKNHKRWLIAVFIIGAILMFILFGFLFYLSSVLEDKFSIDGIKKG